MVNAIFVPEGLEPNRLVNVDLDTIHGLLGPLERRTLVRPSAILWNSEEAATRNSNANAYYVVHNKMRLSEEITYGPGIITGPLHGGSITDAPAELMRVLLHDGAFLIEAEIDGTWVPTRTTNLPVAFAYFEAMRLALGDRRITDVRVVPVTTPPPA